MKNTINNAIHNAIHNVANDSINTFAGCNTVEEFFTFLNSQIFSCNLNVSRALKNSINKPTDEEVQFVSSLAKQLVNYLYSMPDELLTHKKIKILECEKHKSESVLKILVTLSFEYIFPREIVSSSISAHEQEFLIDVNHNKENKNTYTAINELLFLHDCLIQFKNFYFLIYKYANTFNTFGTALTMFNY